MIYENILRLCREQGMSVRYLFAGWSVNGQVVSAGYSISATTVLTAVWVQDTPVSEIDPTSMLIGWLMGRQIAGQRSKVQKVPVKYMYNRLLF